MSKSVFFTRQIAFRWKFPPFVSGSATSSLSLLECGLAQSEQYYEVTANCINYCHSINKFLLSGLVKFEIFETPRGLLSFYPAKLKPILLIPI